MKGSEWMTVLEASAVLDVSTSRVRQLCREGRLESRKVGRDWFVSEADVKERAKNPPPAGRRW